MENVFLHMSSKFRLPQMIILINELIVLRHEPPAPWVPRRSVPPLLPQTKCTAFLSRDNMPNPGKERYGAERRDTSAGTERLQNGTERLI